MGRYGNGHGDGLNSSWQGSQECKLWIDHARQITQSNKQKRSMTISLPCFSRQQMSTDRVLIEPTAYLTLTFLALGYFVLSVACCLLCCCSYCCHRCHRCHLIFPRLCHWIFSFLWCDILVAISSDSLFFLCMYNYYWM